MQNRRPLNTNTQFSDITDKITVYKTPDFQYDLSVVLRKAYLFGNFMMLIGYMTNLSQNTWVTNSIRFNYTFTEDNLYPSYDVPCIPGSINSGSNQILWNLSMTPQGGLYGYFPTNYNGVVTFSICYFIEN